MVHSKDEILLKNNEEDIDQDIEQNLDGLLVQPEWYIDDDGIPYCKKQTDFDKIIQSNIKKRFPYEFEKMLNCQHCNHYKNDKCFFPKSEIDKIESDRQNLKIRCQLCGMKIDRPFSILMSYQYKDKFNVTMPVICCSCYLGLERGDFLKITQKKLTYFVIMFVISLYFIFTYFISFIHSSALGLFFFIFTMSFWGYFSVKNLKQIYYLKQGKKFYEELMNAKSNEKESDRREQFLDEDDKKKPSEGGYFSSGYTE